MSFSSRAVYALQNVIVTGLWSAAGAVAAPVASALRVMAQASAASSDVSSGISSGLGAHREAAILARPAAACTRGVNDDLEALSARFARRGGANYAAYSHVP